MSHHLGMLADLQRSGHRVTPQREMILAAICESGGHMTADEVLQRVREHYPYLNKPAVYRTLELLRDLDLVTQTDFGEGRIAYEMHAHPHHHHLVCRQCRSMTAIDESLFAELKARLLKEYGFAADLDHFAIWGLCRKCRRATRRTARRDSPKTS